MFPFYAIKRYPYICNGFKSFLKLHIVICIFVFKRPLSISLSPDKTSRYKCLLGCWQNGIFLQQAPDKVRKKITITILSASQQTFGLSYFVRPLIILQWKQECDFKKYFISLWHMTRRHGSWTALNFWELAWNCSTWELEKVWVKSGPNNAGVVVTSEMSRQHADFNDW